MKITKTVGQFYIGSGALDKLEALIAASPHDGEATVFLVDLFFRDQNLIQRLPVGPRDFVEFVDTTNEPTTEQLDAVHARLRQAAHAFKAVVGVGGGSTLDLAKGLSNLLTNGGVAADFQGWDLVKKPGVFKIGVPTLSGTGAEASRTCVLMNYQTNVKLGMNSDHTVFDRLILDPDLTETVPRNQYFYSGMDTYIHCIESLSGRYRNPLADAFSEQALMLCREVFAGGEMASPENREKLMVASYLGGSAIGNSFVGVVHPLSAGLSMALGLHHCVANCIVMNVMDAFYPAETDEFRKMMSDNKISLPSIGGEKLTTDQLSDLYEASIVHGKPLANALGDDFKSILMRDKVDALFRRM